MRNIIIAEGEYYHLFNRGMQKQTIFHDKYDYCRFLFSLFQMQSPNPSNNITYGAKNFARQLFNGHRVFDRNKVEEISRTKNVEIIAFTLMPNHFHLLAKENKGGGIATTMQRLLNGYTKYSNAKYGTSGHLFQGPYGAVHVSENDQFLYASAYIHRNCRELKKWKNKEETYPWSSYQDYLGENRWDKLLNPEPIMEQFKNFKEYDKFVTESGAKEVEYENPFRED